MFDVLAQRKRRRVWSPLTVGVSITVHLILLALALALGLSTGVATEPKPMLLDEGFWTLRPEPPPTPPHPVERNEPPAADGETPEIPPPPQNPPPDIPSVRPTDVPINPGVYTGNRSRGEVIGKPPSFPTSPVGGDGPPPARPYTPEIVEEQPQLINESEAQRVLRRSYPHLLRQSGVEGRAIVQAIIDENGMVEPGSVTVISATHEAFGEAAIKAVERFRFVPAKIQGKAVPVMIALPVDWKLEN